jgi:hypothetical protein
MSDATFLIGVGAGFAGLGIAAWMRRRARDQAAEATGLLPADLSHLPASLQETALWKLADGGFESGVLAGDLHRGNVDVQVTAFELETLRERRGEWAFLPVDRPFRIDGFMRVAVFRFGRRFPHLLLKRSGPADQLPPRTTLERAPNAGAVARAMLGTVERVESELPATLPPASLDGKGKLPEGWRAYGHDAVFLAELMKEPLVSTLAEEGTADEVIELLDDLVVVYHARSRQMRELGDPGATPWPRMAQYLVEDGLQIVDAIARVTATLDARGVHAG